MSDTTLIRVGLDASAVNQALIGIGNTSTSVFARLQAIASQPINIPANIAITGENRLNDIIRQVDAISDRAITGSGRVSNSFRRDVRESINNEFDRLIGPGGVRSQVRGRNAQGTATVALTRDAATQAILPLRQAVLQQVDALIGAREAGEAAYRQGLKDERQIQQQLIAADNDTLTRKASEANEARSISRAKSSIEGRLAVAREAEIQLSRESLAVIDTINNLNRAQVVNENAQVQQGRTEVSIQRRIQSAKNTLAQLLDPQVQAETAKVAAARRSLRAQEREAREQERRAAILATGSRVERLAEGGGIGGGFFRPIAAAGGAGSFFGGGIASTLRFALPSAALFGAFRGITEIVREAEELEQIFVRLEAQFNALGARGLFGGSNPVEQAQLATEALGDFREELLSISRDTGVANDQTSQLGAQFVGLFSSIGDGGGTQEFAETATRIAAEFAVITGLDPKTIFDDLVGGVRSFGDTGAEVLTLIDGLTDSIINVSDATGVAAGEITDFVGRIGPAAAQAGLTLEEITAIGSAALQGSGVGGAALAEQFGRILTGLQGELGNELSRLALQFEDTFRNIDLGDETVADLFNVDTVAAGEVDRVLFGLINGFDELSEAQQRQIVASIGSRREGATLAAVLQNASTVNTALAAATDISVDRSERFEDIVARLTGQLARLRSEFTQLGLNLFNAGLADILSSFITLLGGVVDVVSFAADVFITFGDILNGAFGDGASTAVLQLGLLLGAVNLFARTDTALVAGVRLLDAFAGISTAARSAAASTTLAARSFVAAGTAASRAAIAAQGAQGAFAGVAAGARTLTAAIGPLNLAIGAALLLWNNFSRGQAQAQEQMEATRERQALLLDVVIDSESPYAIASSAAANYADQLSNVAAAANEASGAVLDFSLAAGINAAIAGLDNSADVQSVLTQALGGGDLQSVADGLLADFGDDLQGVRDTLKRFDDVSTRQILGREIGDGLLGDFVDALDDLAGTDAGDLDEAFARSNLDELAESSDTPEAIANILQRVLDGELDAGLALQTIDALNDVIQPVLRNRRETEDNALAGLIANLSNLPEFDTEDQINEAIAAAADAGSQTPALDVFIEAGLATSEQQADIVNSAVASFEFIREQYEAGLIGQSEFNALAAEEIAAIDRILTSQIASGNAGDAAVENANNLAELRDALEEDVVERADDIIAAAEIIGDPLSTREQADLLIATANDLTVRRSPEQIDDIANRLIAAEQEIALEAIGRAESVEAAQAIIDAFGLTDAASEAVTRAQLLANSDVSAAVTQTAAQSGQDFDALIDSIVTDIEGGTAVLVAIRRNLIDAVSPESGFGGLGAPGVSDSGAIAEIDSLVNNIDLGGLFTGGDVGLAGAVGALQEVEDRIGENITDAVADYSDVAALLRATGQEGSALAAEVRGIAAELNSPDVVSGSSDAIQLAISLTEAIQASTDLSAEQLEIFNAAILGLTETAGLSAEQFAQANVLFQLLSQSSNSFNQFIALYLQAGSATFNGLLQQVSVLIAQGVNANEALRQVSQSSAAALRSRIAFLRRIFAIEGDPAILEQINELESALGGLDDIFANAGSAPSVSIPRISVPSVSSGGGGSSSDDAERAARELREAQEALRRAQIGDDPVAQASLDQQLANEEVARAQTEAERIRGLISQIEARRAYWTAINDVIQAQNELAITIAESSGDFARALELSVEGAQAQLDFLRSQGAGAAEINRAQAALINAQQEQERGLIQLQLDELGFLFNIGDLSTQAYITALQGILDQLDPVADVDLWRQISLQIKNLRDSSNELQFNLPDSFDLPTLFEVRRLNQEGLESTQSLQLGQSTVDNRQYEIVLNVQTGLDWDEARDVLADALGADQSVFSLGPKRY